MGKAWSVGQTEVASANSRDTQSHNRLFQHYVSTMWKSEETQIQQTDLLEGRERDTNQDIE